jgi:hypothetical protein
MRGPDFVAEAGRGRAVGGVALVERIYATPKPIVDKVSAMTKSARRGGPHRRHAGIPFRVIAVSLRPIPNLRCC